MYPKTFRAHIPSCHKVYTYPKQALEAQKIGVFRKDTWTCWSHSCWHFSVSWEINRRFLRDPVERWTTSCHFERSEGGPKKETISKINPTEVQKKLSFLWNHHPPNRFFNAWIWERGENTKWPGPRIGQTSEGPVLQLRAAWPLKIDRDLKREGSSSNHSFSGDTVDGSEIQQSPVDMETIYHFFIGFYTFQVVVWDFFHHPYLSFTKKRQFEASPFFSFPECELQYRSVQPKLWDYQINGCFRK